MADFGSEDKKAHRKSKSGIGADKKKANDKKKRGLSNEKHNPRAFSVSNVVRTKRTQQRNLDRGQKKEVVPLRDRSEELPPPVLVCVMGPKGVGKSTLIRSLVKIYTGQNISDTKGPITCVVGRKRRITLFECPLDICSMTDMAKVADLVLLMIDASYGLEMETFEFLNQLQLHGFPKVTGVLTHLDKFKANKTLQNTKKALKHRFWTEIYKGAKLFDLSGVINGKYPKHEVKRLSLYVGRIKFRPLVWRNTHPYVMVDRVEDVTRSNNGEALPDTRTVALYGYVRGTHLKQSMLTHLIGAGDFEIAQIQALDDPCPMPGQKDNTTLKTKDNLLYAPLANVGRLQMDRDGLYIDIKNVHYTDKSQLQVGEGEQVGLGDESLMAGPAGLLKALQQTGRPELDKQMDKSKLSLFTDSEAVESNNNRVEELDDDDDDKDEENKEQVQDDGYDDSPSEADEDEDDEDDEDEDEEEEDMEDAEGVSLDGEESYDEPAAVNDNGDESMSQDEGKEEDSASDDSDDSEAEDVGEGEGEDEEEEDEEEEEQEKEGGAESSSMWKRDMQGKAGRSYNARLHKAKDLMALVYGESWISGKDGKEGDSSDEDAESSDDDDLFKPVNAKAKGDYIQKNAMDSSRLSSLSSYYTTTNGNSKGRGGTSLGGLGGEDIFESIRHKFITSKEGWKRMKEGKGGKIEGGESNGGDDSDGENSEYGDFEDLQTGETFSSSGGLKSDKSGGGGSGDESGYDSTEEEARNLAMDKQLRELNAKSKASAKKSFDSDYDTSKVDGEEGEGGDKGKGLEEEEEQKYLETAQRMQEELKERNRAEFGDDGEQARLQMEGYRQGLYVRIVLHKVPQEFLTNFRGHLPVVLGGLLAHETAMGFVRARVKRHRWHKRVLKSQDPLIFSIGWRRFQSMPVYAIEDENERQRHLKYTPEHMHCICTFYGPLVPPNTGILAFQTTNDKTTNFRISLTGVSLELQAMSDVVKKLKLVGHPKKVFKNTAFIEGMFNSSLEVSKFAGAKLKTVSGIRGSIKRPLKDGRPGSFRAAFEDKPLMSDIIICRLWVPVVIKQWYNPVTTLLDQEGESSLLRTVGQIRREDKIAQQINKDSLYKPIERKKRDFGKLNIPKKLQGNLPFASKPKQQTPANRNSYVERRQVVLEPEEKKTRAAVQVLETIAKEKKLIRHSANEARKERKDKAKAKETERFADVHAAEKRKRFTEKGKEQARKLSKMK